jgi:hypothetical protein
MRSRLKALPVGFALLVLLLSAATASAQTYTVTRTDDPNPAPCEPGNCSLRGALAASNSSETVDDVVVLPASAAPYLLQYEFIPFTIHDETEVRGAGANQTVVKGDGMESIFAVGAGVKATLTGLTITGGTSAIQSNSELVVRGVSIEGNKWNGGTAGIITNGPLTVESSFLGFNRTEAASGGAIHANMPVTIVNSTIAHNTSKEGPGAISVNFGVGVTIVNSAFVSNRSETAPVAAVGGAPLTLRNSVFADNRDATGLRSCESLVPVASLGGNVSDDASCGTGPSDKPNVNPLLGTLALHGGTTQVYDLLPGSPAIDAASQCPAVDQRGIARPQGAACDSGPYEFVPPAPPSRAPDTEVGLQLARGKLFLSGKGFARVKLICLPSEASPPCRGEVRLKTRKKVRFGAKRKKLFLGSATISRIEPGRTESGAVRIPRWKAQLVRSGKVRKVLVIVRAKDAAGNQKVIKQPRKLVPL